jgi:hypothetical protein
MIMQRLRTWRLTLSMQVEVIQAEKINIHAADGTVQVYEDAG